jgi:hypothetical protein
MKLPVISGADAVKTFRKIGYELDEQGGSHMIVRHQQPPHRRLRFQITNNWRKKLCELCGSQV